MLTRKEAYQIAVAEFAPQLVGRKLEDETWYYFDPAYPKGEEITGGSTLAVNKYDGSIDWLTIPPLENLDRLKKAKRFYNK